MEAIADYFYLSSLNTPADYLVFGALIMFVMGFVSFFYDPMRVRFRSRYFFYLSIFLFILAVYLGWNDFDDKIMRIWDSL
ncbi:MAG: hypothetical protein WEA58_10610 [Balneolaceae bacterium]